MTWKKIYGVIFKIIYLACLVFFFWLAGLFIAALYEGDQPLGVKIIEAPVVIIFVVILTGKFWPDIKKWLDKLS